jgi:hypothetical protein
MYILYTQCGLHPYSVLKNPPSFHTAFVLGFYEKWLRSKNTPLSAPIIDAAGGWGGGGGG